MQNSLDPETHTVNRSKPQPAATDHRKYCQRLRRHHMPACTSQAGASMWLAQCVCWTARQLTPPSHTLHTSCLAAAALCTQARHHNRRRPLQALAVHRPLSVTAMPQAKQVQCLLRTAFPLTPRRPVDMPCPQKQQGGPVRVYLRCTANIRQCGVSKKQCTAQNTTWRLLAAAPMQRCCILLAVP